RQHYRIVDAATGVLEEGYVQVADMVARQPWLGDDPTIPAQVTARYDQAPTSQAPGGAAV
ncbi:MAG: hypothetical protein GEV04_21790, partial [Actinophytocola sp.]|nr:hypothetical protein [Actinophytocola sp.]